MGVELRQIYLPEHRSHDHNDAPKHTSLNPNNKTEERGPLSLMPPKRQAGGEGTNAHAGDLGFGIVSAALSHEDEGDAKRFHLVSTCLHTGVRGKSVLLINMTIFQPLVKK
jgi:hypothetical protein